MQILSLQLKQWTDGFCLRSLAYLEVKKLHYMLILLNNIVAQNTWFSSALYFVYIWLQGTRGSDLSKFFAATFWGLPRSFSHWKPHYNAFKKITSEN